MSVCKLISDLLKMNPLFMPYVMAKLPLITLVYIPGWPYKTYGSERLINGPVIVGLQAESALMYDAVNVFAQSLGSLDGPSGSIHSTNISCKSSDRWANGSFLYDRLNAVGTLEPRIESVLMVVTKRTDRTWLTKKLLKTLL